MSTYTKYIPLPAKLDTKTTLYTVQVQQKYLLNINLSESGLKTIIIKIMLSDYANKKYFIRMISW